MNKYKNEYSQKIKKQISLFIEENKLDEALEAIRINEKILNDDIEIYSMKAIIDIIKGEYKQAEQKLFEGLKLSINDFDILYNLGYLYEIESQVYQSISFYTKALMNCSENHIKLDLESKIIKLIEDNSIQIDINLLKSCLKEINKVLFVQNIVDIRTNKIAQILNDIGVIVDILFLEINPKELYSDLKLPYNNYFKLNDINQTIAYIDNSDYDVVFSCNEPDYLTVILEATNKPIVHDTHDMMSLRGDLRDEQVILEFLANNRSDGNVYVTKYVEDIAIKKFNLGSKPILVLDNYILKSQLPFNSHRKLSDDDGEIHCVYEGGLTSLQEHHRNIENIFLALAEKGIHVHYYSSFDNPYYRNLQNNSRYLHYEETVNSNELIYEMTKYDIGLTVLNVTDRNKTFLDTTFPNKAWEYLAAGLPILFSDLLSFRNFLDEYNVGEIISNKIDIKVQVERLAKKTIQSNFLINNRLTMDDNVFKILNFLHEVKSNKKNNRNSKFLSCMEKKYDYDEYEIRRIKEDVNLIIDDNNLFEIYKAEANWAIKMQNYIYADFIISLTDNDFRKMTKLFHLNQNSVWAKNLIRGSYFMHSGNFREAYEIYLELMKSEIVFNNSALMTYNLSKILETISKHRKSQLLFFKSIENTDKHLHRDSRVDAWNNLFTIKSICNVCNSCENKILITRPDGQNIVQCLQCQSLFLEKMPEENKLKEIYDTGYYRNSMIYRYSYDYNNANRRNIFTPRLNYINKNLGVDSKNILDIGCANGEFMEYSVEYGWKAKGIEISNEGYSECVRKGLVVYNKPLEKNNFANDSFSCVTMWDVIEHLISPIDELKEIYRILESGGKIYITTPNVYNSKRKGEDWEGFNSSYEHLYFFNIDTMRELLLRVGFIVEDCFSYDIFSTESEIINNNSDTEHTLIAVARKP